MKFIDAQETNPSWFSSALKILAIGFGLAALAACAVVGIPSRTKDSPLPITLTHASSGIVATARAFETSDRLYVSGQAQHFRGYHLPGSAHIDVQLVGKGGQVLAEEDDDIDLPTSSQTFAGNSRRANYVASFPLEQARQAVGIHVTYHLESHPDVTMPGAALTR